MIGVWFTFGPDSIPLIQSVRAFRSAGGTKVAIFDDASKPLDEKTVAVIDPDLREKTTFNRNGNLRGWPCVFGELDCMEKVCVELGGDGCLKIDSDTLVLSFGWISDDAPMSGCMPGEQAFLHGMCYHLRLDALREISASLKGRFRDESALVAEDKVITGEALWLYGQKCNVHTWDKKRAGGWCYGQVPEEKYSQCEAISFGNRWFIKGCRDENEKRRKTGEAMAEYLSKRAF